MGNFDIGLAMVAARIASIETEKEQEIRNLREDREPGPKRNDAPEAAPPLSGITLDVIKGQLVLIPFIGSARDRGRERTRRTTGEGKELRIEEAPRSDADQDRQSNP